MEQFYTLCNEYLTWIISVITNFVFQNKILKIISLLSLFIFLYIFGKYYSTKAVNEKFQRDFINYMGGNIQRVTSFQGDDIKATEFFERIIFAVIKISKQYGKENVAIYQFVINEKPSNPYQLNGEKENDIVIFNNISTKDATLKQKRADSMIRRKALLDADVDLKAFSIYYNDGVQHKTFQDNIKKYQNKLFGKKVSPVKMSGINMNRRGQVFIIKFKKTGHFMVFREIGGAQAHNVAFLNNTKTLTYFPIENGSNVEDIRKYDDGLYSLMQEFDLFLDI